MNACCRAAMDTDKTCVETHRGAMHINCTIDCLVLTTCHEIDRLIVEAPDVQNCVITPVRVYRYLTTTATIDQIIECAVRRHVQIRGYYKTHDFWVDESDDDTHARFIFVPKSAAAQPIQVLTGGIWEFPDL